MTHFGAYFPPRNALCARVPRGGLRQWQRGAVLQGSAAGPGGALLLGRCCSAGGSGAGGVPLQLPGVGCSGFSLH